MRVLVAVDGSECATVAVELVAALDWPAGTDVRIVEVVPSGAAVFGGPWPPMAPLDTSAIVESVKRTGRVLIVHEAPRFGGFAGEIAAQICEEAFEWLDAPIRRVTALDTPIPFSPPLEEYYLPQTDDIVDAARWLLSY